MTYLMVYSKGICCVIFLILGKFTKVHIRENFFEYVFQINKVFSSKTCFNVETKNIQSLLLLLILPFLSANTRNKFSIDPVARASKIPLSSCADNCIRE